MHQPQSAHHTGLRERGGRLVMHAAIGFMAAFAQTEILAVARSNVSTSLRELVNLNLARTVHLHGDRRDHFETSKDVWELFRTVIRERKAREFDPTVALLKELSADDAFANEPADARARVNETLALMNALSSWGDEMLRLEPATLMKVMKLGGKIQTLLTNRG